MAESPLDPPTIEANKNSDTTPVFAKRLQAILIGISVVVGAAAGAVVASVDAGRRVMETFGIASSPGNPPSEPGIISDFVKFSSECGMFHAYEASDKNDQMLRTAIFTCNTGKCMVGEFTELTNPKNGADDKSYRSSVSLFDIDEIGQISPRTTQSGDVVHSNIILECKTGNCFTMQDGSALNTQEYLFSTSACADKFTNHIRGVQGIKK